jgi:hypothetical protein
MTTLRVRHEDAEFDYENVSKFEVTNEGWLKIYTNSMLFPSKMHKVWDYYQIIS